MGDEERAAMDESAAAAAAVAFDVESDPFPVPADTGIGSSNPLENKAKGRSLLKRIFSTASMSREVAGRATEMQPPRRPGRGPHDALTRPDSTKSITKIEFSASEALEQYNLQHMVDTAKDKDGVDHSKPFEYRMPFRSVSVGGAGARVVHDPLLELEEPAEGRHFHGFDAEKYEQERASLKRQGVYVPSNFAYRRLRKPSEFRLEEKILDITKVRTADPKVITLINLEKVRLSKKVKRNLGRILSTFRAVEVLVLRDLGLRTISGLELPNLLFSDLSLNEISEVATLVEMFEESPMLDRIDARGNPVVNSSNFKNKLIAALPHVRVVNDEVVNLDERVAASRKYGKKWNPGFNAGLLEWDRKLNTLEACAGMRHGAHVFQAELITEIRLQDQGLTTFHLAGFVNARHVDLSGNALKSISHTGIETCDALEIASFARNQLKTVSELKVFALCPALRELDLRENRLKKYRLFVVYHTRHLLGTNRAPGLQRLDGEDVTLDMRVSALQTNTKLLPRELQRRRLHYVLIETFGHRQLMSSKDFVEKIRKAQLANRGLHFLDVSMFQNLELLDVSAQGEGFSDLRGVSKLPNLRYFDASQNPSLSVDSVLKELGALTNLEGVSLSGCRGGGDGTGVYRERLIRVLLPRNPQLLLLNNEVVTVRERASVLGGSLDKKAALRYRFELACATAADPSLVRLSPGDVEVGKHYDVLSLRDLYSASGLALEASVLQLAPFVNLEKVNLSENRLRDIRKIGLQELPRLRVLDVRDNLIQTGHRDLGAFFNELRALEVLALRGNPVMQSASDRLTLIRHIPRLDEVDCPLKVIDTEVTISERVQAIHEHLDLTPEQIEMVRWRIALRLRSPKDAEPSTVQSLDLSRLELKLVEAQAMTQLRCLLLRGNRIEDLEATGIAQCHALAVLDVRDNALKDFDAALRVVDGLQELVAVGLSGNPGKYSRERVMAAIPRLSEFNCKLRYLDEQEISLDEMIEARKRRGGDRKDYDRFRFNAVLFRSVAAGAALDSVVELNLTGQGLAVIDFGRFKSLKRLSLARNALNNQSLAQSKLDRLPHLEGLDVRKNKIANVTVLSQVVDRMKALAVFFCDGNPCFEENSRANRVKLLSRVHQVSDINTPLKFLNGAEITVGERIEAVHEGGMAEKHVNTLRMQLLLTERGVTAETRTVNLTSTGLVSFEGLQQLTQIEFLDLSGNQLVRVESGTLGELKRLQFLDLRRNSLDGLDELVQELGSAHSLRHLYLKHATADKKLTNEPKKYLASVCSSLRGLETLDGLANPDPLTSTQWDALKFLYKLCRVGPNRISKIDISGKRLAVDDFMPALAALHHLPVQDLRMDDNPWVKHPQYRFLAIQEIRTLQVLDGQRIATNERANADKVVKELQKDGAYRPPELRGFSRAAGGGGGGGMAARMGNVATSLSSTIGNAAGRLMTKLEIVANFFQQFALYLSFPDLESSLPSFLDDLGVTVVPVLSLEVDLLIPEVEFRYWPYVKFFGFILVQLLFILMYRSRMNQDKWYDRYVENWGYTRTRAFLKAAAMCVGVTVAAYAIEDWSRDSTCPAEKAQCVDGCSYEGDGCTSWDRMDFGLGPTTSVEGWILALAMPIGIMFVLYLVFIWMYRRKHKDTTFWFMLVKLRKRLALFLITIVYMPLAKVVLGTLTAKSCGVPSNYFEFLRNASYAGYTFSAFCLDKCRMSPDFLLSYNATAGASTAFPVVSDAQRTVTWDSAHANCPTVINQFEILVFPTTASEFAISEHWIMLVAVAVTVLLLFGLPIFLSSLVRKGNREINQNFLKHDNEVIFKLTRRVRDDTRDISSLQAALREEELRPLPKKSAENINAFSGEQWQNPQRVAELKALLEQTQENVKRATKDLARVRIERRDAYEHAVLTYDSAQTYLYLPYREKDRFYKIKNLYEKLILTAVASFTTASFIALFQSSFGDTQDERMLQTMCTLGLIFLFLVVALIRMPYIDPLENLLEIALRATNLFNVAIIVTGNYPWIFSAAVESSPCDAGAYSPSHTYPINGMEEAAYQEFCSDPSLFSDNSTLWTTYLSDNYEVPYKAWVNTTIAVLNVSVLVLIVIVLLAAPVRAWLIRRKMRKGKMEKKQSNSALDVYEENEEEREKKRRLLRANTAKNPYKR